MVYYSPIPSTSFLTRSLFKSIPLCSLVTEDWSWQKCYQAEGLRLGWRICTSLLSGNMTPTIGAFSLQRMQALPINPRSGAGDSPEPKRRESSQTTSTVGRVGAWNTRPGRVLHKPPPLGFRLRRILLLVWGGSGQYPYSLCTVSVGLPRQDMQLNPQIGQLLEQLGTGCGWFVI